MDVSDYISSEEHVLAEVDIHDDPYALFFSGVDGTLVCTEQRIVYVSGKEVTDVSINRVDSFQYHAPTMPKTYLYSGIGAFIFAILDVYPDFTPFAYVVGLVLIATAYWLRTSTLSLHTPSETYEFQSRDDDLVEIAHALRERESVKPEKPTPEASQ